MTARGRLVRRDNRLVGKDNAAMGATAVIRVGAPASNAQGSVPLNGDGEGAGRRDAHVSATLNVLGLLIASADTPVTLFPALTALLYRGQCHESKHSIFNPCRCCTTSL